MESKEILQLVEANKNDDSDVEQVLARFFSDDNEMALLNNALVISTIDVIGGARIQVPARTYHCKHLQCFDGSVFLQGRCQQMCVNCSLCLYPDCGISIEGSGSSPCPVCSYAKCPICGARANIHDLFVDKHFKKWLQSVPNHVRTLQILPNGEIEITNEVVNSQVITIDD